MLKMERYCALAGASVLTKRKIMPETALHCICLSMENALHPVIYVRIAETSK